MKWIFVLLILMMPITTNANVNPDGVGTPDPIYTTPATSCPDGHQQVSEPLIIVTDNTSCPVGYMPVGEIETCLLGAIGGVCGMYAPAGQKWKDTSGIYEFSNACAMTE